MKQKMDDLTIDTIMCKYFYGDEPPNDNELHRYLESEGVDTSAVWLELGAVLRRYQE